MKMATGEARTYFIGLGKRFNVQYAYAYPILPGFEHLDAETVVGKECFIDNILVGRIMMPDPPPIEKNWWWIEILNIDHVLANEGTMFFFPELEPLRDMEVYKRTYQELLEGVNCGN